MKHLKSYQIFESFTDSLSGEWSQSVLTDEVWSDISDILSELEDDGFVATKHLSDFKKVSNKLCEDVIEIVVNKRTTEDFNYEEVKDTFMRLIDYLKPYGWNYSILYFGKFSYASHVPVEFECGGNDPLAKVRIHPSVYTMKWDEHVNRDYQTEEMLYKSQLEKILKECQSFKIVFYQSIDHLIN